MTVFNVAVVAILSYLLGSVPFSIITGRLWKGIDVREYGSKNAGVTNVYRVVGALPAIMVLILDAAKGAAAVLLLTRISFDPVAMNPIDLKLLAGIFVIVGHVFPIFANFKGGKGIATGLGALGSIIPVEVGLALALFVLIVAATRYVSLGSLCAASFVLVALIVEKCYFGNEVPATLLMATLFLTAFLFFNHRSNIKRLLRGNENRLGRHKTDADTGTNARPEVGDR
jgi:glycerol-3-phosphate acyltransferase PlsY